MFIVLFSCSYCYPLVLIPQKIRVILYVCALICALIYVAAEAKHNFICVWPNHQNKYSYFLKILG